jgi:hypothetical protein
MKSIIFCLKSFTAKRKVGIKELEFQFKHQSHHTYNSKLTRVPKQIQTIDENYARASAPLPNLHASVKKKSARIRCPARRDGVARRHTL